MSSAFLVPKITHVLAHNLFVQKNKIKWMRREKLLTMYFISHSYITVIFINSLDGSAAITKQRKIIYLTQHFRKILIQAFFSDSHQTRIINFIKIVYKKTFTCSLVVVIIII